MKIGDKYGYLEMVGLPYRRYANEKSVVKRTYIRARCVCGNEKEYMTSNIKNNHTLSCGCHMLNRIKESNTRHGLSKHHLFRAWAGMKQRCNRDENSKWYKLKGITVCDEWRNGFMAFYNWSLANGWRSGLELDRKDGNKEYSPDNCRWISHKENVLNSSSCVYSEDVIQEIRSLHPNKSKRELSDLYNMSLSHVYNIIAKRVRV